MATNNGSAEIVSMDAARARRRAADLEAGDFPSAGAHLKAVREAAGLSLAEVAERTHIKAAFLESIEEMNKALLPSRPFAIGFVKVYAEMLGLDGPALVSRFKEDAGYAAPAEIEHEKFEAVAEPAPDLDRGHLPLLAVFVVVAFILWCAYQIATSAIEPTRPFSLDPTARAADAVPAPLPAAPAIAGAPAPVLENVVEARLLTAVEPVYPQRCEIGAAAVETVEIAFNVTANGFVSGARVATSTNSCFNDAALNTARRWEFSPKTVEGAARPAYDMRYTFRFERPA